MALGRGSWFGISSFIFSRASTAEGSTTSWLGVGFRIAAALFQTCNQAHHEEGWKWWCFPKHSRSSIYADARIWVPWQDILTTPQKTTGKVCVQNSWQNVVWLWKTLKAICFVYSLILIWQKRVETFVPNIECFTGLTINCRRSSDWLSVSQIHISRLPLPTTAVCNDLMKLPITL